MAEKSKRRKLKSYEIQPDVVDYHSYKAEKNGKVAETDDVDVDMNVDPESFFVFVLDPINDTPFEENNEILFDLTTWDLDEYE